MTYSDLIKELLIYAEKQKIVYITSNDNFEQNITIGVENGYTVVEHVCDGVIEFKVFENTNAFFKWLKKVFKTLDINQIETIKKSDFKHFYK